MSHDDISTTEEKTTKKMQIIMTGPRSSQQVPPTMNWYNYWIDNPDLLNEEHGGVAFMGSMLSHHTVGMKTTFHESTTVTHHLGPRRQSLKIQEGACTLRK